MNGGIPWWRWMVSLAGLLLLVPIARGSNELSQANHLLFKRDHLHNLKGSLTLIYELKSSEAESKPFAGRIKIHLQENPQGDAYRADISYLTGERRRRIPSVPKATGNPILKVFLQREVLQMEEATGGSWQYFQKAIKRALANKAQVKKVTFSYRGETVEGTRVRIVPYRNDKYSARMGRYAAAEYDLLLSDAVPGWFYRMKARVPRDPESGQGQAKEAPLLAETLTLQKVVKTKRGN